MCTTKSIHGYLFGCCSIHPTNQLYSTHCAEASTISSGVRTVLHTLSMVCLLMYTLQIGQSHYTLFVVLNFVYKNMNIYRNLFYYSRCCYILAILLLLAMMLHYTCSRRMAHIFTAFTFRTQDSTTKNNVILIQFFFLLDSFCFGYWFYLLLLLFQRDFVTVVFFFLFWQLLLRLCSDDCDFFTKLRNCANTEQNTVGTFIFRSRKNQFWEKNQNEKSETQTVPTIPFRSCT